MHAILCTCYFTRFFIYFSYRRLCITLDAKILCQTLSKHGDRFEEGSLLHQKKIQCIFMHKIKCWSYTIINNNYYYIYIDYLLVLTIINLIFLSICMLTYLSWNKLKRYPVIEKVYRELGPIHLLFWRQISLKTSTEFLHVPLMLQFLMKHEIKIIAVTFKIYVLLSICILISSQWINW